MFVKGSVRPGNPAYSTNAGKLKKKKRDSSQSLAPAGTLHDGTFGGCSFSPYSEVGGDFADFFNLTDGRAGIYVGDVAGKGLSAAMYAALAMGMLRGIHKSGVAAASVLTLLNKRLMVRPVAARYCATLYATFDPKTLQLEFSNAGLPRPLHASTGPANCWARGECHQECSPRQSTTSIRFN